VRLDKDEFEIPGAERAGITGIGSGPSQLPTPSLGIDADFRKA
jgi:hypothetical protein